MEEVLIPTVMPKNEVPKTTLKGYRENGKIKSDLLVFLVDDDPFFLNTLYYFLTDSLPPQIKIKTFSSAEECLAAMNEKPHIIVLDYMLNTETSKSKAMDGLSALKKINHVSAETFVIILSAQDNIDVALDTLKEGAYDYLSKSETAFLRLKTMIKNIAETISQNKERDKEEKITKRINLDRKSTRLNSSHIQKSRMPSSA